MSSFYVCPASHPNKPSLFRLTGHLSIVYTNSQKLQPGIIFQKDNLITSQQHCAGQSPPKKHLSRNQNNVTIPSERPRDLLNEISETFG